MTLTLRRGDTGDVFGDISLVEGEVMSIGRDSEAVVMVPDEAISFQHGEFLGYGGLIFFRDVGSTNGSMLNGLPMAPYVAHLIVGGDKLRLADVDFLVAGVLSLTNTRVFVFRSNEIAEIVTFEEQFPIGLVLVRDRATDTISWVSGARCMTATKSRDTEALLVFERVGEDVIVSNPLSVPGAFLNSAPLAFSSMLRNRDEVSFESLRIVIATASESTGASVRAAASGLYVGTDNTLAAREKKSAKAMSFGNATPTGPAAPRNQHEGRRDTSMFPLGHGANAQSFSFASLEGKLLLGTLVCFGLSMLSLIGYLVVRS